MALPVAVAVALVPGTARSITFGELDDPDPHRNVGALIADWNEDHPGLEEYCSGTLIAPDVFLTAGHCTADLAALGIQNDEVWVSFDPDVEPVTSSTTLHQGTWFTHPGFGHDQSDPMDLAVVVLQHAIDSITPARLPELGLLTRMAGEGTLRGQRFTAVGYGNTEPEIGGGPPAFPYDGRRRRSVSEFQALTMAWLRLSQNPATCDGGTCYGDSGGPNFLGAGAKETDIIASITVTGDAMCRATNVTYRLDTESARSFLGQFVSLP